MATQNRGTQFVISLPLPRGDENVTKPPSFFSEVKSSEIIGQPKAAWIHNSNILDAQRVQRGHRRQLLRLPKRRVLR